MILQAVWSIAAFSYSLHHKKGFAWRLPLSMVVTMLLAYLIQSNLYQQGITVAAIMTQAAVSIINYLLILSICAFCMDESKWTVLFMTTAGVAAQGAAGCVKTLVKLIPVMNTLAHHDLGILLLDTLCYGGVYLLAFVIFRPFTQDREELIGNKNKAIFSTAVMFFYLATTWLTRDYTGGQSQMYVIVTNIYALMIQMMIFTVQFNVMEHDRMNRHMETMRELMHEQHAQYETSRESVQLINEKYHDLKNLIGSIRDVIPAEELDRLKSSIDRYDVRVKTGFEVLDVVLTEKMDLCLQRSITMTCNLGRTDFSFMENMDLYTLFNNALSNAINAVSALPEQAAKYIVLTVSQENNMVTIHMENPCTDQLEFVEGLPQTQGDRNWHGFGMKSMERTAEKYGGALSVSQQQGKFQLDILLLNLAGK